MGGKIPSEFYNKIRAVTSDPANAPQISNYIENNVVTPFESQFLGPEASKLADSSGATLTGRQFISGGSTIGVNGADINPGVLDLRTKGLNMAGESLRNLQDVRENVIGDPNTFVERRTEGLRGDIAREGERLDTRLGKTGVTGEFAEQTQQNLATSGQQKLASGEQLALDEFTTLSNNLDTIEGGMLKLMENIDFNAFTQDLQARGMSQDLKNQLAKLNQQQMGINEAEKQADRQELGNWLALTASFF